MPAPAPAPVRPGHRPTTARRRATALALAAAIALAGAACGDDGGGRDLAAVAGPTSPRLELAAVGMAYDPDAIAVEAGTVEVVFRNDDDILHDLRIEDQPFVLEARAGDTETAQVSLEPGRYAIYCSIPGHREAGMEGVLEVR
jgi:uncharacterized cupredoxin-like copper-binding protein